MIFRLGKIKKVKYFNMEKVKIPWLGRTAVKINTLPKLKFLFYMNPIRIEDLV